MNLVDMSSSENQTGYLIRYILSDCSLKLYTVMSVDLYRLIVISKINRAFYIGIKSMPARYKRIKGIRNERRNFNSKMRYQPINTPEIKICKVDSLRNYSRYISCHKE